MAVGGSDREGQWHREDETAVGDAGIAEEEGLGRGRADGLQPKVDAVGEVEASARPARLRGEDWDGSAPNGDELRGYCAPEKCAEM